ncbi:alpha/beta fold hydrolase [Ferrimonas marina]|uniref:Esterase n=1 Tax=Ferrimonas marina TaxID=299255 RepID=A0A1M5Z3G9_9GAMM|nr:alpha/beta fold hydrolase [Ferrimonas marina]SHI18770.1 esterase [Ferrimonas marina]
MHYQLDGQGPCIVLIHGLFGDLNNLNACARALQAAGFQTLRVSLRNHDGQAEQSSMSFAEMAADLEALRQQLGIEQWGLLGHSLGGKVAMTYAQANPNRCWALLVADIAPEGYHRRHDTILAALAELDPANLSNRSQAQQALTALGIDSATTAFLAKNLVSRPQGGFELKIRIDAIRRCYPQLIAAIPDQPPFEGPTLFVKGALSDYLTTEHQAGIQRRFPRAKARIIAGAGHWLHSQKAEAFNRHASDFFQAHTPVVAAPPGL